TQLHEDYVGNQQSHFRTERHDPLDFHVRPHLLQLRPRSVQRDVRRDDAGAPQVHAGYGDPACLPDVQRRRLFGHGNARLLENGPARGGAPVFWLDDEDAAGPQHQGGRRGPAELFGLPAARVSFRQIYLRRSDNQRGFEYGQQSSREWLRFDAPWLGQRFEFPYRSESLFTRGIPWIFYSGRLEDVAQADAEHGAALRV